MTEASHQPMGPNNALTQTHLVKKKMTMTVMMEMPMNFSRSLHKHTKNGQHNLSQQRRQVPKKCR